MSIVKSKEYREEQRVRLRIRIDQLINSAIETPEYSAGILPIDDLDKVITDMSFSRICVREQNLVHQIEDLNDQISRLKRRGEIGV